MGLGERQAVTPDGQRISFVIGLPDAGDLPHFCRQPFEITCGKETFFAYNEREKQEILEKIEGKKYSIQRSKGLGENQPDMMNLTTMNPATRRLIKVMPSDAEKTSEMFDLLLGDNLQGRKDFIAEYGYMYIDDADLS